MSAQAYRERKQRYDRERAIMEARLEEQRQQLEAESKEFEELVQLVLPLLKGGH